MVFLVTGAAGFIGYFLSKRLLDEGNTVLGLDSLNEYYPVSLKQERLSLLSKNRNFKFFMGRLEDRDIIDFIFTNHKLDAVIHLAAQAGVRYSIENPKSYVDSNLIGFFTVLEACRKFKVPHFLFASSSSVYGNNPTSPYTEDLICDSPLSLYAATKKSNELFAHAYSKLYRIPSTGLRFFTVYGPAGRPDMAYFKFTNKLVKGETIQIYNNGDMKRDFTFIDDIVKGIIAVMQKIPELSDDGVPYKVYNIGNGQSEDLLAFVNTLEECLTEAGVIDEPVEKEFLPMQLGDVYQTFADTSELEKDFGFKPQTSIKEGLTAFAKWYKEFYK